MLDRSPLLAALAIASAAAGPLAAQDALLLPGGAEVCLNGVRITGKVVGPGAEAESLYIVLYDPGNGDAHVATGEAFLIASSGETFRSEVRFEAGPFTPGELVGIGISDLPPDPDGSVGQAIELPARDCTLLVEGGFEDGGSTWTKSPRVDIVDGTAFDHDHPEVAGEFALLSTNAAPPSCFTVDYDGSGTDDCDFASVKSAEFQPFHPCKVRYDVGFYSAEPDDASPQDDFYLFELFLSDTSQGLDGFSLPGISGSPLTDGFAFDDVDRTVTGGTHTTGSAFTGGSVGERTIDQEVTPGAPWKVALYLFDQTDGTGDTGLVLDNFDCVSLYIHASRFETGDFVEWSAAVGGPV